MEDNRSTVLGSTQSIFFEGLDLIVFIDEDYWPDPDNIYNYCCEVMESKDNGKVWTCVCTKSGNIKEYYEF